MPRQANCIKVLLSWSLVMGYIEAQHPLSIRLEPERTVYTEGEGVMLRCVAESISNITGYTFFKDGAVVFNAKTNILTYPSLQIIDSGMYVCTYTKENEKSPEASINLRVVERPPSPTLFVEPQRNVFIKNESTTLTCQPPRGQMATAIHLYQNERPLYNSDNVGVLRLTNIQITSSGNYSCIYEVKQEGQTVESYLSNVQSLTVIDLPPTPNLRYAYSPQNQSTQVELACEVVNPSFSQIHGYHFYHIGIKIGTSGQVNHFIFKYNLSFNGCYFCRTYVIISEQEILSPKSSEVYLSLDGKNERQCQEEDMRYNTVLSYQGFKLYGSILAGKLLVLSFILIIFGVQLLVIRQRNLKSTTDDH